MENIINKWAKVLPILQQVMQETDRIVAVSEQKSGSVLHIYFGNNVLLKLYKTGEWDFIKEDD